MLWWKRYAWLYLIGGLTLGVIIVLAQGITAIEIVRSLIFWIPSPMLVFAYCRNRYLLNQWFWKFYFFFLLFDTIYDIWQVEWSSYISVGYPPIVNLIFNVIEIALFLPAFYIHLLYAFRPHEISKK